MLHVPYIIAELRNCAVMIVKMSLFNFCFLTCLISGCLASLEDEFHTNSWVIEVPSGSKHAREIAAKHNFLFRGEVSWSKQLKLSL